MSKFTNFLFGTIIGGAVGFVAGSLLVSDDQITDLKTKVKNNDTIQDLKKKYDNGTEIVKNQLASFPKTVEDDTEIKDFDDIVIDNTDVDDLSGGQDVQIPLSDLNNAEPTEPVTPDSPNPKL